MFILNSICIICVHFELVNTAGGVFVIFPERLKETRKNRGLSTKDMAEHLGFSAYAAYQKYERGAREPDLEKLIAIAKYLDVSVDYLLGLKDEP